MGIEMLVMDDGWFGERNDDTSSLGDWDANPKKLPHGLKGLGDKLNAMGMQFGIWVEPEMVNQKSKRSCRLRSDYIKNCARCCNSGSSTACARGTSTNGCAFHRTKNRRSG